MGSGKVRLIAVVIGPTGRIEKMSLLEEEAGVVSGVGVISKLTSTVLVDEESPGEVAMKEDGAIDKVTVTVAPASPLSGSSQPKRRAKKSLRICSPVRDRSPSSTPSKKFSSGIAAMARAASMSDVDGS